MMWRVAWWKEPLSTGKTSFYLLAGKESFLKKEFIESLRKRLFPDGSGSMNTQEFSAEKSSPSEIFDFVNTSPFGALWRLVIVWGIEQLDKEEKEIFLSLAGKSSGSAVLVLESEESPKKDSFLKKLSEIGKLEACHTPFERDLPGWAQARARKYGVVLDREAVLFLIACSGNELSSLCSNIEQLALFVHPKTRITLSDAETLLQKRSGSDVFRLAELLLDGRQSEALRVLHGLFEEGVRAPEIVAGLAGQIERWKRGSMRLSHGLSPEEIGFELRIPSFFQGAFFAKLRNLSPGYLSEISEKLLHCDESFKSGRATERLAVEKFIWTSSAR